MTPPPPQDDADPGSDAGLDSGDRYRAPALDKGLDILEILAAETGGLTRADLVRRLGRSASEFYRMLERLVARGYVARLDGGDRYALTMKLFLLAQSHPPRRRLMAQAQPEMDRFANETLQSCHLVMVENGRGVVVAHSCPRAHWQFHVRVGAELDLFNTGSGRTILAFQDPDKLPETLAQWGIGDAAAELDGMREELAGIARAGWRQGASAQLVGVIDLSVPIFGPRGEAVAVLTCPYIEQFKTSVPVNRAGALERLRVIGQELSLPGTEG